MDPEKVGMSSERLARVRPIIEKHVGEDRLAGVVALAMRRGEIILQECVGEQDRESGVPMSPDTIFRIYSMTKPITCVAMMTLYERGLFRLSDPVSRYIPAMANLKVWAGGDRKALKLAPLDRPVTIRDLMTHTAGMTYHFFDYGPVEQCYRESQVWAGKPLEEHVRVIADLPLVFQPGSAFRYSVAHDVVGHLVEILADKPLDEALAEAVLKPLEMNDTGFCVPLASLDRFATMYGSMNIATAPVSGVAVRCAAEAGMNRRLEGATDSLQSRGHGIFRGGSGLVSTAPDYLRFCRMLLGGGRLDGSRVLGPKTVELMVANHLASHLLPYDVGGNTRPGYGYGLGMRVLMDLGACLVPGTVGEYGWGGAATTYFWVDPAEELIGVVMAQFQPSGFHPIADDFRVAVYQAIV